MYDVRQQTEVKSARENVHKRKKTSTSRKPHLSHGFRQADGGLVPVKVCNLQAVALAVAEEDGRQCGRRGFVGLDKRDVARLFRLGCSVVRPTFPHSEGRGGVVGRGSGKEGRGRERSGCSEIVRTS